MKKNVTIRLEEEMIADLQIAADKLGISLTEHIRLKLSSHEVAMPETKIAMPIAMPKPKELPQQETPKHSTTDKQFNKFKKFSKLKVRY